MVNKRYVTNLWFVFCLLIETICVTDALKIPSIIPTATILYFLSGIIISLLIVGLPSVQITRDSLAGLATKKPGTNY
ncbi:MAG: hypothetical protein V4557_00715 [Bacteroidota bacterium]